jgi:N-acetyl-gamma-glutamylphosphate reductase
VHLFSRKTSSKDYTWMLLLDNIVKGCSGSTIVKPEFFDGLERELGLHLVPK